MATFKLEPEVVEREGILTITEAEAKVLKKLLGELSCDVAESLGLSQKEYNLTYNIYDAFE